MTASPPHRPKLTAALIAAAALAYVAPLALSRYFPGLDLPFHAAAIRAVHLGADGVAADFLGHLGRNTGSSSYWLLYALGDGLTFLVGDPIVAVQLLLALYVAGFVFASASLYRAVGVHPALALLAAPAAYSVVVTYGFLPFALGYPLTLWLWAAVRRAVDEPPSAAPVLRVVGWSAAVAVAHPLSAALAGLGAAVLLATFLSREARARVLVLGGAVLAGMAPAIVAIATQPAADPALPGLMRDATLWQRYDAQPFVSLATSIGDAPARLFPLTPDAVQLGFAVALLFAAGALATLGGRAPRQEPTRPAKLSLEILAAVLVVLYLIAPANLDAPLVVAVQPRVLPLIWVVGLALARPARTLERAAPALVAPAVVSAAGAAVVLLAMVPFAAEARDFRAATSAIPPRVRTLALVEHAPVTDDRPAEPWRHFPTYVMAERGGYVSDSFFATGSWLPLRRVDAGAGLRAPRPGQPRTFDWTTHGAGWDYIAIRDADPRARFDYFRGDAGRVERVAVVGRWRVFRVRAPGP